MSTAFRRAHVRPDADTPVLIKDQPVPRVSRVMGDEREPIVVHSQVAEWPLSLEDLGAYLWLAARQVRQQPNSGRALAEYMAAMHKRVSGEETEPRTAYAMHLIYNLECVGLLGYEPEQDQRLAQVAAWEAEMIAAFEEPASPSPRKKKPPASATSQTSDPLLHAQDEEGGWSGTWPLGASRRPPQGKAVVYILFSDAGRAVYVGSTDHFVARMKAHRASGKRWATWSAHPCDSRDEAYAVEAEYLAEYMPHLNVQGPQFRRGDDA